MKTASSGWPGLVLVVMALAALQLWLRPLLPVDETRYLSVAWEMWQRGDFLVPHLDGVPYSHKPPLLFWLVHGLWWLTGVSEAIARWVFPLVTLLCLWLSAALARRLWPHADAELAAAVPWLLFGGLFWMNFYSLVQFDLLLVLAALLAWHGTLLALVRPLRGWSLVATAIGIGVLAKGPVILLPVLPVLLLAPWWARDQRPGSWSGWYAGTVLALLLGAVIALVWAIPAGLSAGDSYRQAIFWGQSAGRMVDSFAHASPWWSYLWWLPLMWLPWVLWPQLWKALRAGISTGLDDGIRFCLAALLPALLLFSLVSGKQGKYLLPLFPLIALLLAHWLTEFDDRPTPAYRLYFVAVLLALVGFVLLALPHLGVAAAWSAGLQPLWALLLLAGAVACLTMKPTSLVVTLRCCVVAMALATAVVYLSLVPALRPAFDLQPVASHVANLQAAQRPVAWLGKYHGQLHFLGRMDQRIEPLTHSEALRSWTAAHPQGYLIENQRNVTSALPAGVFTQAYRSGRLAVWPVSVWREHSHDSGTE